MARRNTSIQPGYSQQSPEGEGGGLIGLLEKMRPAIATALPKHCDPDRMARIALTAIRKTPKLAQCTPHSFLGSLMEASQLGLELNSVLGHAWILPYRNGRRNCMEAQFILGYQGMLELARREGSARGLFARCVHAGDVYERQYGTEPSLKHVPHDGAQDAPMTHVYACGKVGGEPIFTDLTLAQVLKYRDRSKAAKNGPWVTDFEAMAEKTAIRRLFRWLPRSADLAHAVQLDEAGERVAGQSHCFSPEVDEVFRRLGDGSAEELGAPDPSETVEAEGEEAQEPSREPGEEG